jgi:NAD(P)-dependent dehydrogenase (short-subunit alcohol dehydrogenase family)
MAATNEWARRTVLVTGAAGGIGRATVAALLAEGAGVVAFDASAEALDAARGEWGAGERVRAVVGDVGEAADVARAFAAATETQQPLGGVVGAAGIYGSSPVEDMTDAEWHRVLRVNLRGMFLTCQAAARAMAPRRAGTIVTMASGVGLTGGRNRAHYAASKMGVAAFTKALALELAPHGIRANALAPGTIDTAMPRQLPGRTEDEVQAALRANPLRRAAVAGDVADLILFLLSARSSHITGQVVAINGGLVTL